MIYGENFINLAESEAVFIELNKENIKDINNLS